MSIKTYQDIVHGAIQFPGKTKELNNIIKELIDTSEFQRLRHIRQNGLTNIVFHGMEHSRFAHSIGVAHVAYRMYQRILINSNITDTIDPSLRVSTVVSALLHDIGHGPFSHTFEDILRGIGHPNFSHENMTVRIITEDTNINKVLNQYDHILPNNVIGYIDKNKQNFNNEKWIYKIVSSQLDADRLDYVLRDATMSGLKNTTYDLSRILNFLYIHPDNSEALAVSRHAIEAVESYLLALDQLYRAIYYHKAVRSASVILNSILKRAADLFTEGHKYIFPTKINGSDNFIGTLIKQGENIDIDQYVRIMDSQIWVLIDEWRDAKDEILSDLCERLISRKLFKSIIVDDAAEGEELKQKAIEYSSHNLSFINSNEASKYYVKFDVSKRKTYQPEDAIWLFENGEPKTLQDDDSSKIISIVREQKMIQYLMFPSEIQELMKL